MASDRWVVLGLAHPRAPWFRSLSQWATAGSLPLEFSKCQSAEELRARLASGRPVSAVLLDGGLPSLDRDLIDAAAARRCPAVVVDHERGGRDWRALGASAVLPPEFGPTDLLDALAAVAVPVVRAADVPGEPTLPVASDHAGRLVAVCGPGGTGASSIAIALAQGVATSAGAVHGPVVLADLCRHADQAMLHDARDVLHGVQELAEAHRSLRLTGQQVRGHCVAVPERGYDLLLGLRRSRSWAAVRPRAFVAAVAGLRSAYATVVADVDADLESEADGGSLDVEERNAMARTAVLGADVVVVVGLPGLKGVHGLVRVVHEVAACGVLPARILPVVNRAPRSARVRAELTQTLAELCALPDGRPAPPLFLAERKVDEALRDGVPLPSPLPASLARAVAVVLERAPRPVAAEEIDPLAPVLVRPGSLGALVGADDGGDDEGWDGPGGAGGGAW